MYKLIYCLCINTHIERPSNDFTFDNLVQNKQNNSKHLCEWCLFFPEIRYILLMACRKKGYNRSLTHFKHTEWRLMKNNIHIVDITRNYVWCLQIDAWEYLLGCNVKKHSRKLRNINDVNETLLIVFADSVILNVWRYPPPHSGKYRPCICSRIIELIYISNKLN